jgi:hypothetical protein
MEWEGVASGFRGAAQGAVARNAAANSAEGRELRAPGG